MGRSDSIIFEEYKKMTFDIKPSKIAFLGFNGENEFTRSFDSYRDFYDLSLGNWNINDDWSLESKYDFIVCTRCPYFARDPETFVRKCKEHLLPGGSIFIDWGLGDHWRFPLFKVGWVRNGEHEFAYVPGNYLYSCMWRKEFRYESEVIKFWENVKSRYDKSDDIDSVVRREVPSIIDYECDRLSFKFLWPDSPQLYIMTLIRDNK